MTFKCPLQPTPVPLASPTLVKLIPHIFSHTMHAWRRNWCSGQQKSKQALALTGPISFSGHSCLWAKGPLTALVAPSRMVGCCKPGLGRIGHKFVITPCWLPITFLPQTKPWREAECSSQHLCSAMQRPRVGKKTNKATSLKQCDEQRWAAARNGVGAGILFLPLETQYHIR